LEKTCRLGEATCDCAVILGFLGDFTIIHFSNFAYSSLSLSKATSFVRVGSGNQIGKKLQHDIFNDYKVEESNQNSDSNIFQVPALKMESEWYELLLGEDQDQAMACINHIRKELWEPFSSIDFHHNDLHTERLQHHPSPSNYPPTS
jgi:hypothetical protein